MTKFIVDPRKNTVFGHVSGKFIISAENIQCAADIAARKIFKNRGITAHRQTGDVHKSGMFNGYVPAHGGLNSHGSYFHLSVATDVEIAKYDEPTRL